MISVKKEIRFSDLQNAGFLFSSPILYVILTFYYIAYVKFTKLLFTLSENLNFLLHKNRHLFCSDTGFCYVFFYSCIILLLYYVSHFLLNHKIPDHSDHL